ncbi:hypothetical protein C7212DRAFT_359997 [Tuber magnatum]|uniref:Trypsin-like serine protease n=1 Tax=Tuber magnatum TaxID=42249 RepID=A0A317SEZ5_9PEZI|nr:hypothetical protein C7212DRAFT_359997 [Tuber magnatum]
MASPQSSLVSDYSPISPQEAKHYYHGLYSKPVLVARTGTTLWTVPRGPEAYLPYKELRPVGSHPLTAIWEDNLALEIHNILEWRSIQWTSTDVVRIGIAGESVAPVIIWIGVKPNTLSGEDGFGVAQECKQLLVMNQILDVEIEIRESIITRFAGPKFQKPGRGHDPLAELLEPLTSSIGLFICNANTPWIEGTGGFYVMDDKHKLYLVTARHVVLPSEPLNNSSYKYQNTSQPRIKIALLGTAAFYKHTEKIKNAILGKEMIIELEERRIAVVLKDHEGRNEEETAEEQANAEKTIEMAKDAIVSFKRYQKEVLKGWSNIKDRILGHIYFSPALKYGAGEKGYTEDYALIEIDDLKIDTGSFTGNAIDLGTDIEPYKFTCLMFPNPQNRHSFKYPINRLFKVQGIITEKEIHEPTMLDQNYEPCLIVMKRGNTTGLTIGRANNVSSFSTEWAICPYDKKSGPFSEPGDSGSSVVDCLGRLGGLITSGSGATDSTDITYATPITFIMDSLRKNEYKVTLNTTIAVQSS